MDNLAGVSGWPLPASPTGPSSFVLPAVGSGGLCSFRRFKLTMEAMDDLPACWPASAGAGGRFVMEAQSESARGLDAASCSAFHESMA
jgi:hypothetical protein